MSDPLAGSDDVAHVLKRDLEDSEVLAVEDLLLKASQVFRIVSKQHFTEGTSTVRLKVNGGRVRLDQRPVTAVTAVVDDDGDDVTYTRTGSWLRVDLDSSRFVTVTYTHGGDVPDEVRVTVAEMVARALSIPEDVKAGARSMTDTAGPVTQITSYGDSAQRGVGLTPDERELAQSYLWPGGQVIVQTP